MTALLSSYVFPEAQADSARGIRGKADVASIDGIKLLAPFPLRLASSRLKTAAGAPGIANDRELRGYAF
jgi:hypothetical protein